MARLSLSDILHDEVAGGAVLLDAVDACDIRVVQRGERLRFAFKAHEPIGVGCKMLWKRLDGHHSVEAGIRCRTILSLMNRLASVYLHIHFGRRLLF